MNENNEMGAEGSVPMNDDFNAKLDFLNTHVTDANRESLKAYNAYRDQGLWDTATPDHQATIMAGVNDLYNAATQAPAQDAQQEFKIRMDKRYQQANDIRTKAQYVINQNGDNADLSKETQNAQAYIDFLENNNSVFDNMTDDKASTLLAGVNDLYERAKSRRGHAEKFWDSIKQGYEDTGTMNAMGLKVLKPGEMTQDDKEVLQGLNDVQNRNHILTPKGVEDIRDISSVGDFFDFALGSIGSNAARAAEAAGLGVVAAMTGGAAVPAYATAASMVGGFVGSLPQSIGEVTGGQLDEKNHDFSRAAAIGEGVGYALLDSITGVVPGLSKVWSKLVKSAGGKLTKEALLKSAQQLTKDATKRELLKEIGKEALGEALTEPAQSGIVTRTRRYIQTGTPYTEDEIATGNPLKEALWDATNEAIGGALTSLGMGAPGKIANHVHAKHTMELANNVANKVMRTEEFKQLSPEYQYLVASHIMYDAMYATQGAISTNREVEDSVRANMQARSQDIDTLLKEASSNGDKNAIAAQTLLKAFDATTNYQDVVTVMEQESAKPNGLRSLIDREAMVKNRGFFFSGDGKNIQGTVFTDDNTGIAIVHNKNGEYIVLNNKDFGDPIGAPESVKTLDEAIKLADAFSVANQVTEREEAQRMEVVKNAVEKIFGKRDITIIPTHNRDIANARNESPASYDTENNTLYLNVDGIRNFGDLYTALMHERGHQDLANQLTQATPEIRVAIEQAIANSRGVETMKGRYLGADGELTDDARTIGEELLVERSSVADVVKALNAMSQGGMTSALARVFNAVRAKMGADTGIPTGLITDADVRKELAFLNDNGYLGASGNGAVFAEPTLTNAPNTRRIEKDVEIAESREAFKRGANAMLAEMLAPKADAVPQLGMKPQAIVTPQTEMNAWKSAKDPALALVEMIQGLVAKLKEADTLAAQRAALAGVAPQATEKMTDAEVTAVSDKLTDGTQTIEEMAKSFENLAQGEFTFTYPEVVENPAATDAQKPVDTKQKNTEKPTAPITAENAPTSASQEEDKSIPMEAADAPQGEIEASTAKEEANVAIEDKNKEVEAEKPTTKKPVKKTKKAAVKVEDEKVTETRGNAPTSAPKATDETSTAQTTERVETPSEPAQTQEEKAETTTEDENAAIEERIVNERIRLDPKMRTLREIRAREVKAGKSTAKTDKLLAKRADAIREERAKEVAHLLNPKTLDFSQEQYAQGKKHPIPQSAIDAFKKTQDIKTLEAYLNKTDIGQQLLKQYNVDDDKTKAHTNLVRYLENDAQGPNVLNIVKSAKKTATKPTKQKPAKVKTEKPVKLPANEKVSTEKPTEQGKSLFHSEGKYWNKPKNKRFTKVGRVSFTKSTSVIGQVQEIVLDGKYLAYIYNMTKGLNDTNTYDSIVNIDHLSKENPWGEGIEKAESVLKNIFDKGWSVFDTDAGATMSFKSEEDLIKAMDALIEAYGPEVFFKSEKVKKDTSKQPTQSKVDAPKTETPKAESVANKTEIKTIADKVEENTESIYAKDAEAKAQKALTPKRGEKVVARLDGRVVNGVYLKDNGNGTSDIQVREPGRNRFEKGKVYNATIKNEDVKTTIVNRATKFKTASTGPAHDFLRENARKSTAEFRTAAAKHGLKFKTVRDHLAELGKEPFADGEIDKHGMESFHVVRHGDRVYKFRNAENSQDHELMNVEYFNEVFPNTAYTIEGFAESNGKIVTVLSQRYVDMDQSRGDEARKGILDDIKKRLGSAELRENEIHAGEWMVDDLKDANIGIEKSSGKPVVIDARIHKLNEMPKKLWWDGDTDRVNAIVDNSGAFDANNQDIRYKTRPNGKQKSANTAYPDASTEIRAIPSGVRYKSRNRNIVFTTADNTDYLGGAKENLRAHGIVFDELDLDPSISNEEARTRAEAVRRDAVSLNAIMERASNGTPLTDVESLALILEGRDRLINLTASRMGGNLSADENALQDAALNRVLYAVRMAGRQAGKTLQQYRRLFALDKAQDMEGYIIGEARAEMDRRGLTGDIPEDIQKRIHQMASDLQKANEALEKAQAKMVEMEEKAAADAAELELARSRKQFRLDAAIQKKVNQFFGDSTITQDDLFAIGRMEEIFGVTHNDAKHKSTSSVNSGMAQEVSDIFSHLLCKANFDMDKVAAFVDSYNNAKMTEAFTAFRQRMESGAVNTTEEEKANRVKEVAEKERETVTRRNRVRIIARKPITNRISLTLEDLERRVESARNKCVQAMEDFDGNADAQRKALGRYLRTYQRMLVAKNPELTDAEVYAKMAEEAKAVHSTGSYDATEMLYVLTGKKGFSMEQRTAMNQRVSLLKAALAEAKRGNLTKAASMAGIAYHSESDTLAEYTQKLQNTLDTATRKLADILANPLPDQQAQVDTINQLKDEIVSTKQAIDDLYKDTKMAEKRARYIAYLENRLTALNEEMDNMVREVGDVEARRARIAELNARIGELKHELTEAQKERNLMKRLERQIDEYQRRIDEQDFETPVSVKKPIEEYSKRVQVMMRERDRMRELYKKERQKFEYRKLSKLQKAGRDLMEIIGETKAIVGSFDLSAMFRQGGQLVFAHPLIFKKNFVKTLKIFKSEEYARQVMDEIKARPNFRFYEMAKIDFTDWGEGAVNAEDRYLLNKYRAMMKVKPLALGIQASERSFSMFLNLMRADCFDALVANSTFGSAQNMNKQQLLALGNFVNIASQRGAVDQDAVGKAIPFLNTILWSPRNIISRFQFLWNTAKLALPGTDPYGDKTLRGLFAKELGRYLLGVGIMIAFSKMLSDLFRPDDEPPQDIVLDPRSSDFMKVRFGNARVDVLSGLTPILVLGARLFSGTTVNSRGQEKDTNAPELVGRFLRTKLAPGVSYFWDLFVTKESFDHQEIMWSDPLVKNENEIGIIRHFGSSFTPLAAQDIVKQMEMNGASRGMITSLFTILGAGVQAYNPYTFRQLSGDYYYFRRQWLEAKDSEERRKLETLHPMLRHQGEISNQLKTCNFWKKQIRLMEKQGNTEAVKRFTEHLEKAQQIAVNMMAGFPKPTKID